MVKMTCFHCRGYGFDPWLGTKISHTEGPKINKYTGGRKKKKNFFKKKKKIPISLPSLRKQECHHPQHVAFIVTLCVTLHRVCSRLMWWEKITKKQ